jgi:hypothetical protein
MVTALENYLERKNSGRYLQLFSKNEKNVDC